MKSQESLIALVTISMLLPGVKFDEEMVLTYRPEKQNDVVVRSVPGEELGQLPGDHYLWFAGNGNARKNFDKSPSLEKWVNDFNKTLPEGTFLSLSPSSLNSSKSEVTIHAFFNYSEPEPARWVDLLKLFAQQSKEIAELIKKAGFN